MMNFCTYVNLFQLFAAFILLVLGGMLYLKAHKNHKNFLMGLNELKARAVEGAIYSIPDTIKNPEEAIDYLRGVAAAYRAGSCKNGS